ncbi:MAG TPA: NTP transferase domain-containing protein [Anaerolineae bacterium]|nr:NTP transferase domain-containing protein [Anaerolineae bacterium]
MNKNYLTAVVLAGGAGTRIRSITDKQKVMVEINNRPFITYILDFLKVAGFQQTIICTGYKPKEVLNVLGDDYHGMHLEYSAENKPLGTAGAVINSLKKIDSENILVLNGDSLCDVDINNFVEFYINKSYMPSIVCTWRDDLTRYGNILFNPDKRITSFQEKSGEDKSGWINAGLYLMKRDSLNSFPRDKKISIEYDVFPKLINKGLFAFLHKGKFIDIGTPESFLEAASFLKDF